MLRENFDAGKVIIKEGDAGNVFYMVEEGSVDVSAAGEFVRTMEQGAFFGEQALLNDAPRSATCTAKTKCTLLAMARENFEKLFGKLKVSCFICNRCWWCCRVQSTGPRALFDVSAHVPHNLCPIRIRILRG